MPSGYRSVEVVAGAPPKAGDASVGLVGEEGAIAVPKSNSPVAESVTFSESGRLSAFDWNGVTGLAWLSSGKSVWLLLLYFADLKGDWGLTGRPPVVSGWRIKLVACGVCWLVAAPRSGIDGEACIVGAVPFASVLACSGGAETRGKAEGC